jgi:DNA-binding GntR family transcriptional regulator
MGAVLQASTLREAVWDEHAAIAEAIAAGDPARAERLMREHDERASDHITRHLDAAMRGAGIPLAQGDTP